MGNVFKIPVLKADGNYKCLLEKYGFEYFKVNPEMDIRHLLGDADIKRIKKLAVGLDYTTRNKCEMDISRYYAVTMWELR